MTDTFTPKTASLLSAIDSPTVAAMAKVFDPRHQCVDKSYSEQIVEILAPRLAAQQREVQSRDAMRALADLFSESVHETWTKDEIVNIIEDAIAMGASPVPSADQLCPNCKGTKRAIYFSEQGWKHEERDCHLCARSAPRCPKCGKTASDPCETFKMAEINSACPLSSTHQPGGGK